MCSVVDDPFADQGNADAPGSQLARYAWSNVNVDVAWPLLENIVPQGDLILAVGPSRKLFAMASSFLCEISPVFAVMLGPNFEEGKSNLYTSFPKDIMYLIFELEEGHRLRNTKVGDPGMVLELPDDDAQALCNTIRVLYGADPLAKDYEPADIQKIAIIVDKYDMVSRFTFASTFWFAKYAWADDPEETWQLTTAAYWLECPDAFFAFSKKLIKQMQVSHLGCVEGMPDGVFGLRLCLAIEEHRVRKLIHNSKQRGLCLYCFKRAQVGFTSRVEGCKHRKYH
ncbi:hypothetical protein FSARC_3889 [Fusarium sarcochroum]|uniref:BTB domain-containing protein n=1 Tax=Fusarium sarcochroum TaxID=1208366 RepID=A0A8H4U2N6_9HYPO|nr:hypothetical protein FSARC_3889 [Fusarium sarcochroum]